MNYPDCPNNTPDKCRFENQGGTVTLMHCPVLRDRQGNAVGGGSNVRTCGLTCWQCNNRWGSHATELEDAQGKPRQWTLVEKQIHPDLIYDEPHSGFVDRLIIQASGRTLSLGSDGKYRDL